MRTSIISTLLAAAAFIAAPANASVVFSDNFDAENGGNSALNYTGFTNFASTGGADVDLVATPDFGITCAGGSGSCVDLDGSPGPGEIETLASFAFNAGDLVSLSLSLSGNQRGGPADIFQAGFRSQGGAIAFNNVQVFSAAFGNQNSGNFLQNSLDGSGSIGAGVPFGNFTLQFKAGNAGSLKFYLGSSSLDAVGPLVDNVSLSIGAVPEPATWAMMIAGFGLVGGAMRRRAKIQTAIV